MSCTEILMQAAFILISIVSGLMGPTLFFRDHDPLYLFTPPFAFRWHVCFLSLAGGLLYTIVLSTSRKALQRREQRQIRAM